MEPACISTSVATPEYATPECDALVDVVAHDKAGERILEDLVRAAEERLIEEGIRGEIYLFKNNTRLDGQLVRMPRELSGHPPRRLPADDRHADSILREQAKSTRAPASCCRPLVGQCSRWLSAPSTSGKGSLRRRPGVGPSSTRGTKPHADAERYRRLHVIAGDSNMSEYVTFVKIGATAALLQMLEADVVFRDLTLENPIRAIREISHDPTCRRPVRLANGRELSALDIQWEYLERVMRFSRTSGFPAQVEQAIGMWEYLLTGLEKDPMSLNREIDWVMKYRLIEQYREKHDLAMSSARLSLIDLAYHDVSRKRGLYYLLERRGLAERVVTDEQVALATTNPPATTRAHLRGSFIKAAKAKKRDFTVDWVHLKLNDQAQRTVLCKDPFRAVDERVEKLIENL